MAEADGAREIAWTQHETAGVKLRRFVGHVGTIEVAATEYDGSNQLWLWSSPLAEDAWGWAANEEGAKAAVTAWLRQWLSNFRAFL
jgi:hypothetical protein